jgi:nicotinamidase-related amidase
MDERISAALETIFAADSELYLGRGFKGRIGFGERPALLIIDLANAWTRPDGQFSCDGMDTLIPGVQRLLSAARRAHMPVLYTTTYYDVPDGPNSDLGLWRHKGPAHLLTPDTDGVSIDDRIAPMPGEHVIVKKFASAFHGTYLDAVLRAAAVDTLITAGLTMSGCVRHTVEDALAHGYRPIVVRECVGDRVAAAIEWNLFDVDAKFGDVESLDSVLGYLEGIQMAHASG